MRHTLRRIMILVMALALPMALARQGVRAADMHQEMHGAMTAGDTAMPHAAKSGGCGDQNDRMSLIDCLVVCAGMAVLSLVGNISDPPAAALPDIGLDLVLAGLNVPPEPHPPNAAVMS